MYKATCGSQLCFKPGPKIVIFINHRFLIPSSNMQSQARNVQASNTILLALGKRCAESIFRDLCVNIHGLTVATVAAGC